jgi:hypothetical protein
MSRVVIGMDPQRLLPAPVGCNVSARAVTRGDGELAG